jgi:8-oxo-dGTP pyrophosphatase MutT (NUDIX family)
MKPAVALMAFDSLTNSYLMVTRKKNKEDTVFPGGKFEKDIDSNLEEALAREVWEETGFMFKDDKFPIKLTSFSVDGEWMTTFYLCSFSDLIKLEEAPERNVISVVWKTQEQILENKGSCFYRAHLKLFSEYSNLIPLLLSTF